MSYAERQRPTVVKESPHFRAMALMLEGYVKSWGTVRCALCSVRFLLLLDPDDRTGRIRESENHRRAIAFFREKITQDHVCGHPSDRFLMS
jgi:hypothetical protein